MPDPLGKPDPWQGLRQFTAARIALGHTGVSQPTAAQLDFQLAHARARDAVHLALDAEALARELEAALPEAAPCLALHSAAENRHVYLQRPDLGRRLDAASRALAGRDPSAANTRPFDVAFVVADGLSSLAVTQHAAPFLALLRERLQGGPWSLAPLSVVRQGRVAVGDEVGELLGAKLVVVLIGERPGLSSPDSMGLYITWMPAVGLTDERRNCISNVRPAGQTYGEAAARLHYLLAEARRRQLTGVGLKDESGAPAALAGDGSRKFLL
ncbi:ethanolamine ammonia-lyase subunit EutC [Pseudoduganella albidiflava]|uniref:Ethanolamine ammonia-lyase small subunit n=1 Tax=Pseudoduganella albidiflava TaxID=321983 RepID=A0A411X074_9BURK|nr:ethanolamine ammonia-lyase subunit EutC [Pseudoduganella albidiflava]QBI02361.1 ethanolamine ammonia-lyase subunit EutC [Pseudoduganella albidiflava]GGY43416.1 ethanolamine ammonia-lyase light chain [Pseudoduganella albidiflava]